MRQCRWRTQPWSHAMIQRNDTMQWCNAGSVHSHDTMHALHQMCSDASQQPQLGAHHPPPHSSPPGNPPNPGSHSTLFWCCLICIFFIGKDVTCIYRFSFVPVSCWLTQLAWDIASHSHDSIQQMLPFYLITRLTNQSCSCHIHIVWHYLSGDLWWYILMCCGIFLRHMTALRGCHSVWETS